MPRYIRADDELPPGVHVLGIGGELPQGSGSDAIAALVREMMNGTMLLNTVALLTKMLSGCS
jgi:hypothetical protein